MLNFAMVKSENSEKFVKISQLWRDLEVRFIPPEAWESDLLTLWREKIAFSLFFFAAVLGPFALIPSLILSFNEGLWGVFIMDSTAYLVVLLVLFSKKCSLKHKTWLTFLIFYSLGTGLLFILGFYGGGYIWLFGASLIVGAMIGLKAAGIALAINFFSLVSIGIYIAAGSPQWAMGTENAIEKWMVMTANFMVLDTLITLLVAVMLNSLKIALTKEQKTAIELRNNIVERKKWEIKLQQSQRMESIGTLAAGIAHDFNNILSPILGHTEMLLMDVPENKLSQDSLNQIHIAALRAKSLIKQILEFSRQENYERMPMKIQPIIKEALRLIRSTIPTTIEIKQDINPHCGIIKADPTQIHQIIMNLTTNSFHAMEETGGKMQVSLNQIEFGTQDIINPNMAPGGYVCLTIADTGVGMEKQIIDKIFDPFFTTKEKGRGTGMGLSVVHGIVTAMGGVIHVYSEPGKGTQFQVYLPTEKNPVEEQNTGIEEAIQGGVEHILLVDDEENIITMEKRMLERLGYHVTSHTSSLDALDAFRSNPDKFDLVITDMTMPNMPGDKLSIELLKIRHDIPILICTGFSEVMPEEKTASLGIKGFLFKPISMKELARKIRKMLDT